jgi:zona occludens toxin
MIELITGLPGNCKTLYTIAYVRAWAKKDNRPVYYSGVPLTDKGKNELGWIEVEPEKWMECPPGAIIVIDECQRIFRNRSINSQPPKYVSDLETHRHLGIDLVFITQHPMLVDPAIRRLTGRHRHMVRIFGMAASTVHQWDSVRDNCDKPAIRKDSEKTKWVFDKSVYPLYRSAELHTGKVRIPKRVLLIVVVPIAIGGAVYTVKHLLLDKHQAPSQVGQGGKIGGTGATAAKVFDPVADARQYVFNQTPRVQGLQYTAPKYDELTKPSAVPVPAACVHMGSRCSCYTQQATPIDVTYNQCLDIAHHGYFQEFDANGNRQRVEQSRAVLDRPDGLPLSHAQTRDVPPNVAASGASFGSDGFAIRQPEGVRQPGA